MIRYRILFVLLFIFRFAGAQDEHLADTYFRKGEFEKAAHLYAQVYQQQKHRTYTFTKLIKAVQAQEKYKEAETLIRKRILEFPAQKRLWADLGYNFDLQHQPDSANVYYKKALDAVYAKPANAYPIARSFYDNHLLDYALESFLTLKKALPHGNYSYQIASIYGEKGDISKMFDTYLDQIEKHDNDLVNVKHFIGKYITDDDLDENNRIFRKLLVQRLQNNPQDKWNKLLSWLYLQQKDYSKALRQEIAVHKRSNTDLDGVVDIGKIAFENRDFDTTQEAFNYIVENTGDQSYKIAAHYYLLERLKNTEKDKMRIEKAYTDFFTNYGTDANTTGVQVSYARFLAFEKNEPRKAVTFLQKSLKNHLNRFDKAAIKILLSDILVFTGKYKPRTTHIS